MFGDCSAKACALAAWRHLGEKSPTIVLTAPYFGASLRRSIRKSMIGRGDSCVARFLLIW
jgi:hypothetical protein